MASSRRYRYHKVVIGDLFAGDMGIDYLSEASRPVRCNVDHLWQKVKSPIYINCTTARIRTHCCTTDNLPAFAGNRHSVKAQNKGTAFSTVGVTFAAPRVL
ncbi:hypothetical protein TNCV_2113871 [Trichonephila clavipes]|nr:hypothetical protein TNCV_2113871 [Trichonephila clavipes]